MPEESFEEKTEQPTPKRLREARERGSVAKSTELNSAVMLLLGLSFLYFMGPKIGDMLMSGTRTVFMHIGNVDASVDQVGTYYTNGLDFVGKLLGPFFVFLVFIGLGVNVLQIGFLLTARPLEPDLGKLSPIKGFKQLFSLKGFVEGAKGTFKVILVFGVAFVVVKMDLRDIFAANDKSIGQITIFLAKEMYKLGLIASLILLVMALFDYAFQRWNYHRSLKMTKQEVKEERKQLEGDPMVKARIKSLQREMARRRMMDEVPKATVVVTNPTFIAIALRYEAREMDTPQVVAKGKRLMAERIKKMAVEHGIPIVEDKPLARGLYDLVEPGDDIPPDYFPAVAEILAYVYKLQNRTAA